MKEQIKELRVKIDGLSQLVKELRPNSESVNWRAFHAKETEKAYDSLILAKAWLGKVLGELGEETPYTNDGNRKTVEDIEPAADRMGLKSFMPSEELKDIINKTEYVGFSHIQRVDWLRQEIEVLVNKITEVKTELAVGAFSMFTEKEKAIKAAIASTNTYSHLCEARFWLGFELQRIKEENEKQV